ncbi:cell division protein kinase 2 homolog [Folsomia candida]|nr:cell division protein kinase 2 homolog [Folsomia candida]
MRECKIATTLPLHENIVKVIAVLDGSFTESRFNDVLPERILKTVKEIVIRNNLLLTLKHGTYLNLRCLQMELCGENLRQWLNHPGKIEGPTLLHEQFSIIKNLIDGLAHLHKHKILHRDLKPENVMFSQPGFVLPVKIGDFGLCRYLHSEKSGTDSLTSWRGTVHYMAPESQSNEYSFSTDLYSLGLIIWEVAQLIKSEERHRLFQGLTIDKDETLVTVKPETFGLRDLVIALTKRKEADRLQDIHQINKQFVEFMFCDLKQHYSVENIWNFPLIARDEMELHNILSTAKPGSTIQLIKKSMSDTLP